MKFLCDRMLGTLAKWLRIYGFDTYYASSDMDDKKLIEISKNEDRVFITRDKTLVFDARRENVKVIQISETDIGKQLKQILKNTKVDKKFFLSRCLICNSLVEEIKKKDVENKVPEKVFENNDEFWYCSKCDKIYWKGSHYDKMISTFKI